MDTVTWQALGLVLTLVGLGLSVLVWSRRGAARGLRAVALSLIPLAAALTGTLRLAGDVAEAVSRWAGRLVFDPLTWTGFVVAGVAVLLFVVSGRLLRREPSRKQRSVTKGRKDAPAVGQGTDRGAAPQDAGSATGDPELDEIEQLLRRRGIT